MAHLLCLTDPYLVSVIQHGSAANDSLSPYVTIVAEAGTDNALVTDSFHAYWAFKPDWGNTANPGFRFLVRQKITLVNP